MGALVGGVYAAGRLPEFEQWVRAIRKADILALLDISWRKSGLVKGDRIINTLVDLVGDQLIENLSVRYTAVAADIRNQKEVWINSGRLFDAIRASISMPLFFTPYERDGVPLVDGGVLNPVPIAPTFGDGTQLTIAVNLGGAVEQLMPGSFEQNTAAEASRDVRAMLGNYIKRLGRNEGDGGNPDWGAYDIANQSFDAMQSTIARQKLAAYPPDVEIEIARNACGTLEFDRAAEMIELGYRMAQQRLDV